MSKCTSSGVKASRSTVFKHFRIADFTSMLGTCIIISLSLRVLHSCNQIESTLATHCSFCVSNVSLFFPLSFRIKFLDFKTSVDLQELQEDEVALASVQRLLDLLRDLCCAADAFSCAAHTARPLLAHR